MTDILMPSLTDGMESGTIVAWLVEAGETVAAGDELVEIETDKATMAWPSEFDGTLEIVVPEGETVAVGTLIARIGDADPAPAVGSEDRGGATQPASEPAPPAPRATVAPDAQHNGNGNGAVAPNPAVLATPLARRIAASHGIALAALRGTGPAGRVTKQDVFQAAGITTTPAPPSATATPPGTASISAAATASASIPAGSRRVTPTRLQQIVARRMLEATTTVPHFQVQTEALFDAALELRAGLKRAAGAAAPPSVNDLIVKACALALREHPIVNASFVVDAFALHEQIHVGVAVAAEEGLLVVTVRDADRLSLGEIARQTRELAERARTGSATPAELTGATFTVSNLGMFGMTAITPVINPPQAAILGVGAARPALARGADGQIVEHHLLTLTLSGDHRILNGADGARFLATVKDNLEAPLLLVL